MNVLMVIAVFLCASGIGQSIHNDCADRNLQSDYGATHSTVPSAMAGMDMELPNVAYCQHYPYHSNDLKAYARGVDGEHLVEAVKKGDIPKTRLDDMARR